MMTKTLQLATCALFSFFLATGGAVAADDPRTVKWDDLVPPSIGSGVKIDLTKDRAAEAAEAAHSGVPMPLASGNQDATVAELDGKRIRIPAFLVPIDGSRDALTELLLVPYFGACMHVPPPPPNQIIYVQPEGEGVSIKGLDLYDAVWATGTLRTQALSHDMAEIGYKMDIEKLEAYKQ